MTHHKYKLLRSGNISLQLLALALSLASCKKLVDVNPPVTSTTGDIVYTSDATAIAALTGIYTTLSNGSGSFVSGKRSISLLAGLSADELTLYSGVPKSDNLSYYYVNALHANTTAVTPGTEVWSPLYSYIFICNSAIQGIQASTTLTPSIKQQLLGEATFLRAFFYFYLVNLYGDVPLTTTIDYTQNALLARSPKNLIYQQIIQDLKNAQNLLSTIYPSGTLTEESEERVRPTKWAACALLARAYLYMQDWQNAETQASSIINNSESFNLPIDLNATFLKNSKEAIWQLQPVNGGWNTEDAKLFIIPVTGPDNSGFPVYLSPNLLASFEAGDLRKKNWIDSVIVAPNTFYFPHKYKVANFGDPISEYLTIFRLSEQYLIRAEARANQNNIPGSQNDLNLIRSKAGLPNTTANNKFSLLASILHERRIELFTEFGHRWMDIKRTNTIDAVMTQIAPIKGGTWNSSQQLYPLPLNDIQKDPNLTQNPGY